MSVILSFMMCPVPSLFLTFIYEVLLTSIDNFPACEVPLTFYGVSLIFYEASLVFDEVLLTSYVKVSLTFPHSLICNHLYDCKPCALYCVTTIYHSHSLPLYDSCSLDHTHFSIVVSARSPTFHVQLFTGYEPKKLVIYIHINTFTQSFIFSNTRPLRRIFSSENSSNRSSHLIT
jgi:hypothetical protein